MCVIKQAYKCKGWLPAVGQSMLNRLKPKETTSSMESAPTYTRYVFVLCFTDSAWFGIKYKDFFPVSFMRSAQLQSGNAMKIFRFRDRLAGGALYSGRWGEDSSLLPALSSLALPALICNSFYIYFHFPGLSRVWYPDFACRSHCCFGGLCHANQDRSFWWRGSPVCWQV